MARPKPKSVKLGPGRGRPYGKGGQVGKQTKS